MREASLELRINRSKRKELERDTKKQKMPVYKFGSWLNTQRKVRKGKVSGVLTKEKTPKENKYIQIFESMENTCIRRYWYGIEKL